MKILKSSATILGVFIYAVTGVISLIWEWGILVDTIGFFWALVSYIVFPLIAAILAITPIYVGVAQGDWRLAALSYGGGFIATIFFAIGNYGNSNVYRKS